MSSRRRRARVAIVLVGALVATIVASLLLAPAMVSRNCFSVDVPGDGRYCGDTATDTLLGYESNLWLWIGSLVLIVVAAGILITASQGPSAHQR
ncbi:hypothetical protein MK786_05350 [Microbacterium sp. CFH 31415]|uniref:hypothetical protein n=1 Tax=Microbacterium sp. CFH 31415 TaxID=2921732 RepID=UPI001F13AD08|nr:hypothetical protein [Microbacterium sp. CFH 31415]MCH6230159.1 hypothetical protein [Microbacterium sp. CFH 31415]